MQFRLRVLDRQQQLQTLTLEALDEADARGQALAQRFTTLSIAPGSQLPLRRDGKFELLLFAQELHALLSAGLSVIEALETLVEKDPIRAHRTVLERLAQQLREGQRLSGAMRQQPAIFPALFTGIVQAAEGTSDLPQALSRFIDYETRMDAVRHKVVSAAIYPAILLVVGGGVGLFLLGYVVPRFASVYQGTSRTLPWASRMLLDWGEFAGQHATWLYTGFAVVVGLGFWWTRQLIATGGWWRMLRVLPGARPRLEILQLSRLYLTLGMLLEGGIPVRQSLRLCGAVLDGGRQAALSRVREDVESGQTMSDALERHGLGTPVALRLLRAGEHSGQLGTMFNRTAAFYETETARWIERFTKAFEPILMAAIGIVIGLIVILLYMPIFDLAGSIQ